MPDGDTLNPHIISTARYESSRRPRASQEGGGPQHADTVIPRSLDEASEAFLRRLNFTPYALAVYVQRLGSRADASLNKDEQIIANQVTCLPFRLWSPASYESGPINVTN